MTARSSRSGRWLLSVLVLVGLGGTVGWYSFGRDSSKDDANRPEKRKPSRVTVELYTPRPSGLDRLCEQPGSIEPFAAADLYAKVSGFLSEQAVDIGSPVKVGDVLARIAVPELEKQVKQDAAEVTRAEAKRDQAAAAVTTAAADEGVATSGIAYAQADLKSRTAYKSYRESERNRIRELVTRDAIEPRKRDEEENQYQAAVSAEAAAGEAVVAARKKEEAAAARIEQAKADQKHAEAEILVAKARLEKSQVLADYAVIRSPYTGVVTKRNFHVGDFIRSADTGGERVPVLAVERTDKIRVVVQVPEKDVPLVAVGQPAVVEVDALPGTAFKTTNTNVVAVSRFAASEDPHTRMMRVEVDLQNPDGKLRRGMFGRVSLLLQPGSPAAVRIPTAALVGKAENGKASVRVVRDDIVAVVTVQFGTDNGAEVEVLSGLSTADRVVVRASGPVENGTQISVSSKSAGKPAG